MSLKDQLERYILDAAKLQFKKKLPPALVISDEAPGVPDGYYNDGTWDCTTRPLHISHFCHDGTRAIPTIITWKACGFNEVRGIPLRGPYFLRYSGLLDDREFGGLIQKDIAILSSFDGKKWKEACNIGSGRIVRYPEEKMLFEDASLALGIQCWVEYCWTADIAFDCNTPAVRFTIDQTMMEQLLKMRDIPPGKKRRDRIIHLVHEYKRSSGKVEVPQHYRGHIEHLYEGCQLVIAPPVNDLVKVGGTRAETTLEKV